MAPRVKKSKQLQTGSSTPSPKVDRLSRLPPELLDRILDYVYTSTGSPSAHSRDRYSYLFTSKKPSHPSPISKLLAPFQRRRYTRLSLPSNTTPSHVPELLSQCDSLIWPDASPDLDVQDIVKLLPHPERLQHLEVMSAVDYDSDEDDAGERQPASAFAASLVKLTSLKSLSLDCACDFAFPPVRQAFRTIGLERLSLGRECEDSIPAVDVLKLVKGKDAVESLKSLTLDITFGEEGYGSDDLDYKPWLLEGSWTLPEWPDRFTEQDTKAIVAAGRKKGVEVDGTAVEAIGMDAEYQRLLRRVYDSSDEEDLDEEDLDEEDSEAEDTDEEDEDSE
ncbi:hypothetical protein JCM8097_008614 [Rhodosporidiobolus ruineniae]